MNQQLTFDPPKEVKGKLVFSLTVPGRLPSWNEVLGIEQWARYKFKQDLAKSFELSLRASAKDSSMTTTLQRNSTLTYCATLESYQAMRREQRRLRLLKKKLNPTKRSESSLKSLKSKLPF